MVEQKGCPRMNPLGTLTLVKEDVVTCFDIVHGAFNITRQTHGQSDLPGYSDPFRISISIDTNSMLILVDPDENQFLDSTVKLYLWRYFDGYVDALTCLRDYDNGTGESTLVFLYQCDEIERVVFHKIEEVEGSVYVEMEVTTPDNNTMEDGLMLTINIAAHLKVAWLS